jgi:hypothetical protein
MTLKMGAGSSWMKSRATEGSADVCGDYPDAVKGLRARSGSEPTRTC